LKLSLPSPKDQLMVLPLKRFSEFRRIVDILSAIKISLANSNKLDDVIESISEIDCSTDLILLK
jgi:hypothetical protein